MSERHRHTFSDAEDMSELNQAFLDGLLDQRDKAATQMGWTIEANGGWRMLVLCTEAVVPSIGSFNVYVLDDTRDYRDRMIWFAGPVNANTSRLLYPGHADDSRFNLLSGTGVHTPAIYYTRLGYADPPGADLDNYFAPQPDQPGLRMWARDTDGALMLGVQSVGVFVTGDSVATMGLLYASPVLNVRSATTVAGVSDADFFDAADGEAIEPHDLNNLQDGQHVEQAPPGTNTFALGAVLHGDPPLPYEWTVRGETVRQRLLDPQLRRYASFTVTHGTTVTLDAAFDWRDRHLFAVMWYSTTTDRRPGQAGDTANGTNAAADVAQTGWNIYTRGGGTFSNLTIGSAKLGVDVDDGSLYFVGDDTDDIVSANIMLFASPRLGPRSAGLPSPRRVADPTLGKVSGRLVDSATSDLTNIVARWRFDRGLALDGGKVAAIADQSGNGYHLVQRDPLLRAVQPEFRDALNGAAAMPLTGVEFYDTVRALPASSAGYFVAMILEPVLFPVGDFRPWELLLPLATEGQIESLISGELIHGIWRPDSDALADEVWAGISEYRTRGGEALAWNFTPSGGRLVPSIHVRETGVGSGGSGEVPLTASVAGAADVQSLVWRLMRGFRGYVAEIIVCDAVQDSAAVFFDSADIASRYSL